MPRGIHRRPAVRGGLAVVGFVAATALGFALLLDGGKDPEAEQAAFVAQARRLCQSAERRMVGDRGPTASSAAPLAPDAASQNAMVRLKLVADLGRTLPRVEQRPNLDRLRAELARRSRFERELADLGGAEGDLSPRRAGLEARLTGSTIALEALAGVLGVPPCGRI